MITTRDWLEQTGWGGGPVRLLGSGAFGEAWLLRDGTVAKLTHDDSEALCVGKLVGGAASVHLPVVYQTATTPLLSWSDSGLQEDGDDPRVRPHFAWRREELGPVPGLEGGPPWSPRRRRVLMPLFDIIVKDGLVPDDAFTLSNWGQRADGTIVYRDTSCVPATAMPRRFATLLVRWFGEALHLLPPGKAVELLWMVHDSFVRLPDRVRVQVMDGLAAAIDNLRPPAAAVVRRVFPDGDAASR